jgi:acyl-CoA reductase-like NAD-dependent aldehyde dehydrogenase
VESGTAQASTETTNGASANGGGAEQIDVHNPATGDLVATVAADSPARVAEVIARVRANQPEWEAMGIKGR